MKPVRSGGVRSVRTISSTRSTRTTGSPGDRLAIASIPNLRDVGGYPTSSGRTVRTGVLYRSGSLAGLDDRDVAAFERLGLRAVYDLRTAREQQEMPDRLPAGVEHVQLDVLAGWTEGGLQRLMAWFDDPAGLQAALGDGAAELWAEQYRSFVTLPSAQAAYGTLFRNIAIEARRPALFHCATGKDRTGWAAAVLLLLAGVPDQLVMADFLRSRDYLAPVVAPFLEAFAARGGDPALLQPIFAVVPEYLAAGLEQVRRSFGSIEAYLADGLGVDQAVQEVILAAMTV